MCSTPTGTPATIQIDPNNGNYATITGIAPACGSTARYVLSLADPSANACCGCAVIPYPALTITDANGSSPFIFQTSGAFNGFYFAAFATLSSSPCRSSIGIPGGTCTCNQTQSIGYFYLGQCVGNTFYISRAWTSCIAGNPCALPQYVGVVGDTCVCATGGFNTDASSGAFPIDPCAAFVAVGGPLTPGSGNIMPDPVLGPVLVS